MIWLAQVSTEKGFIYDINIYEGNQGRGYGKKAMKEIEQVAKNLGLTNIGLHVFGHNKSARGLYEKSGYIETDIVMAKDLV
jgi:ribosomal protein S18 acetylase RimI-like enzyme